MPVAGVPSAFAIRDADPGRVKLYVDGFEVPALVFGGRALWLGGISHARTLGDVMDDRYAGTTGLEVTTDPYRRESLSLDVTPMDASLVVASRSGLGTGQAGARYAFFTPAIGHRLTLDTSVQPFVEQGRVGWRLSRHWTLDATALGVYGVPEDFGRSTLTARYDAGATRATLAVSAMAYAASTWLDTRAEVSHTLHDVAGLSALEIGGGETTSVVDGDRFDGGAWLHAGGRIGKTTVFGASVRADVFDHQVALSPRGALATAWGDTIVAISAAATRQAQVDRDATPERATEVVARVTHAVHGLYATVDAYYIDRSRILVDGKATGVGTAYGVEERIQRSFGAWLVYAAGALGQATRAVRQTAPDHAADHDVPLRLDLLASWVDGDWRLAGRVQLRSGLPYTPVTGAVYDADTDSYSPLDGKVNSERAPWRRQLDLRVDRRFGRHLRAYLDVALDGGVLGYTYSYDYAQRLAVRAPIVLPWLGIVGSL